MAGVEESTGRTSAFEVRGFPRFQIATMVAGIGFDSANLMKNRRPQRSALPLLGRKRAHIATSLIQAAGVALLAVLAPVCVVMAGSLSNRVKVHNAVQVDGGTVRLSDLLPPDAAGRLEETSSRVSLGGSPLPDSQLVISRDQIERQLRDYPSTLKKLEIPDRVVVTRKRRRLSAAEIQAAIQDYLKKGESRGLRAPNLNGLKLQAPVFVTKQDPGLEVKSVDSDLVQRKTRFLLWTSKEPQTLPFYVSIEGLQDTAETTHKPKRQETPLPVVLVAKGKSAKLTVESPTMRMTTLVTPLESGVKGQYVLVRNEDSQRVLKAEVVGAGLLQVRFREE